MVKVSTEELDRGLDTIRVKGRSLTSSMTCNPLRNFQYHTDVKLGALESAPTPFPVFVIFVIDARVMLGGGVLVGEGIGLGEPIPHIVDKSLHGDEKEEDIEEEGGLGLRVTSASSFFVVVGLIPNCN